MLRILGFILVMRNQWGIYSSASQYLSWQDVPFVCPCSLVNIILSGTQPGNFGVNKKFFFLLSNDLTHPHPIWIHKVLSFLFALCCTLSDAHNILPRLFQECSNWFLYLMLRSFNLSYTLPLAWSSLNDSWGHYPSPKPAIIPLTCRIKSHLVNLVF